MGETLGPDANLSERLGGTSDSSTPRYREPTAQEIEELGLVVENGYSRCSDPQCGDSTWDHDCDDYPQHRWTTDWQIGRI